MSTADTLSHTQIPALSPPQSPTFRHTRLTPTAAQEQQHRRVSRESNLDFLDPAMQTLGPTQACFRTSVSTFRVMCGAGEMAQGSRCFLGKQRD